MDSVLFQTRLDCAAISNSDGVSSISVFYARQSSEMECGHDYMDAIWIAPVTLDDMKTN